MNKKITYDEAIELLNKVGKQLNELLFNNDNASIDETTRDYLYDIYCEIPDNNGKFSE